MPSGHCLLTKTSEMNEHQLVKGCKANDRKAQKLLYETYARKMMGVCVRYVNDTNTAADLLQDGFVKVFTAINSFSGHGSFEGWIRRIIVNSCLEHLRRTDALRGATDIEDAYTLSSETPSANAEITEKELQKIISDLPNGFRTIFNLYAIEGYSHREISETLGISEGTSRSQYTRARQILQKKVKEMYAD